MLVVTVVTGLPLISLLNMLSKLTASKFSVFILVWDRTQINVTDLFTSSALYLALRMTFRVVDSDLVQAPVRKESQRTLREWIMRATCCLKG